MYAVNSPSSAGGTSVSHNNGMLNSSGSRNVTFQQQQDPVTQGQRPIPISGQHLDDNVNVDETEFSTAAKPRLISNNRVITTEETVSSSLSSNSPQRNMPLMSGGPPPPLMSSSLGLGHDSDDNETMIDSNNREVATGGVSLVRPCNHVYSENNDPMVAITREDSIKDEREQGAGDEDDERWISSEKRLLDPKGDHNNNTNTNNNNNNNRNNNNSSSSTNNNNNYDIESEMENEIENPTGNGNESPCEAFEIATFPTLDLLEMLTALLDKIVKSNDRLAEINGESTPDHGNIRLNQNNREDLQSVLSFRGKHIPQISLKHYFQRIQKYCPTTNDVFLSLLVYFDRISKKCNSNYNSNDSDSQHNPDEDPGKQQPQQQQQQQQQAFVMDSHNIHRLLIAGVTVSTKFFSDFFYSNSRYARVGGISLQELNHLELQFLVLCDFELLVSTNELQRYADLLYKFWNCSNEIERPPNSSVSMTA